MLTTEQAQVTFVQPLTQGVMSNFLIMFQRIKRWIKRNPVYASSDAAITLGLASPVIFVGGVAIGLALASPALVIAATTTVAFLLGGTAATAFVIYHYKRSRDLNNSLMIIANEDNSFTKKQQKEITGFLNENQNFKDFFIHVIIILMFLLKKLHKISWI